MGKYCDTGDNCRERKQRCRRRRPEQMRPAFPQRLKFPRQLSIAELIVIEVHDRDAHSMLYFARTEIVQQRSPMIILLKIFSGPLGKQNMTGVPEIHHAVGYVQASARQIGPAGYINNAADWPTMN